MRCLIDLQDFSLNEIDLIIKNAFEIKKNPEKFSDRMKGKILANLFFEPSTRTQFSFQSAMFKLGGQTLGLSNTFNTSVSKGESFKDTIKVVSEYADILVIRHFLEGAAFCASIFSSCPVINAGDGAHLHPTQTLIDMFTILEYKGRLNGLTIGICGDLRFSRTVNSLIKILTRYENNTLVLISTSNFKLSSKMKDMILNSKNKIVETSNLKEVIGDLDVLYINRIQKERIKNCRNLKDEVILLNEQILKFANKNLIIMHPLPKVGEISDEIDKDERAIYFKQALNGIFVRMAILLEIFKFNKNNFNEICEEKIKFCKNENCITNFENNIPKLFFKNENEILCKYCDK